MYIVVNFGQCINMSPLLCREGGFTHSAHNTPVVSERTCPAKQHDWLLKGGSFEQADIRWHGTCWTLAPSFELKHVVGSVTSWPKHRIKFSTVSTHPFVAKVHECLVRAEYFLDESHSSSKQLVCTNLTSSESRYPNCTRFNLTASCTPLISLFTQRGSDPKAFVLQHPPIFGGVAGK